MHNHLMTEERYQKEKAARDRSAENGNAVEAAWSGQQKLSLATFSVHGRELYQKGPSYQAFKL